MDRICISAASDSIKSDLSVSDQVMGYIFGVFAVGYALFQIPAGWVIDRFGPKKALSWIVISWSSFTALSGAAWNAISLIVLRFLFGIGEAGAFPGATKAFYRWIPAKERGIANGIFHSGARAGAAISLFLMPFLIRLVGWRWTFFINGIIGLIWVSVWLIWYKDDPVENRNISRKELDYINEGITGTTEISGKLPLGQILTSSNMLLMMFQYVASNITFFISFTWLLPYLVSQWGEGAEIYAPVPLLFGMAALWFSGWLSAKLYSNGWLIRSRKIPAIAGFTIATIGLILITMIPGTTALSFTLLFSIAVFGVEMTISPSWSLCMDIGRENSATVSAAMNMLGNIGSAFSAIIFPFFVSSVTVPYIVKTTGTANSFFLFAALVNIMAVVAWLLIRPGTTIGILSPEKVRRRLIAFFILLAFIASGVIFYKFILN